MMAATPTSVRMPTSRSTRPSVTNFSISALLLVMRCTRSPFFPLAVPAEGDTLQVSKQLFAQPRAQALGDVGGQEEIEPCQRRAESGENNKDDDRKDNYADHAVMRDIGIDQRARVRWIGRAGRGRRRHRIMASRRRVERWVESGRIEPVQNAGIII